MPRKSIKNGFSLVELLIVVAIIGIIAAILIPNLLDALQKAKQKRTMADMRDIGIKWFSWLTDQIGAASAGAQKISYSTLFDRLRADGSTFAIPETDGWGTPYCFCEDAKTNQILIISAGSDGIFDPPPPCDPLRGGTSSAATGGTAGYQREAFLATDYAHDIVWADGFFVQWPEGTKR